MYINIKEQKQILNIPEGHLNIYKSDQQVKIKKPNKDKFYIMLNVILTYRNL